MVRRIACAQVMPMEYAASHCPLGTETNTARMISEV
jgi:hypothetical protein